MQRLEAPRWGRIDQDIAGTAAGNWFLDGTMGYSGRSVEDYRWATAHVSAGFVPGKAFYSWSHLALAPHGVQPGTWIFSTGWWQDERGEPAQWMIDLRAGQPAPSQLTAASGMALYRLTRWFADVQRDPDAGNAPYPIGYGIVTGPLEGIVAVQVNPDGTLSVEIAPSVNGQPPTFSGFTEKKRIYRR